MTGALWTIAAGVLILAAVIGWAAWRFFDDGDLETLTEDDVADLIAPHVDRLLIMAADTPNGATEDLPR